MCLHLHRDSGSFSYLFLPIKGSRQCHHIARKTATQWTRAVTRTSQRQNVTHCMSVNWRQARNAAQNIWAPKVRESLTVGGVKALQTPVMGHDPSHCSNPSGQSQSGAKVWVRARWLLWAATTAATSCQRDAHLTGTVLGAHVDAQQEEEGCVASAGVRSKARLRGSIVRRSLSLPLSFLTRSPALLLSLLDAQSQRAHGSTQTPRHNQPSLSLSLAHAYSHSLASLGIL